MTITTRQSVLRRALARLRGPAIRTAVLATATFAWIAGCSDNNTGEPEHQHTVATLALDRVSLALQTGETATVAAAAACYCGAPVTATTAWTSSDPAVASVTPAGVVTGVSFGSATITATASGKTATLPVQVAPVGTVVGVTGGTVTSADGSAVLIVPPGALDAPADIRIVPAPDATFASDPLYIAGSAWRIEPAALQFRTRARLRIVFNPANVPPGIYHEQLRIRARDQNQWRVQEHQGLAGQIVEALIDGPGVFAVVIQPAQGALVGPLGGTVLSSDDNVEVLIPAGALGQMTDIVISKADDAAFGGDPLFLAGSGYRIDAEALNPAAAPPLPVLGRAPETTAPPLNAQIRIRLRYRADQLPPGVFGEQLRIRLREQTQWQDCDQQGLVLAERRVQAWTNRFGLFGLVVVPPVGAMIGPAGGTALSADGNAELIVPAGALTVATDVVITKAADAAFAGEPRYVAGTGYRVEPATVQLQTQARLRLRYDPAHLPTGTYPEQLRIRLREQDQTHDCDHDGLQTQNRVQARINGFGLYGLVVAPPAGALIGPAGGIAVSADGNAQLLVPAGALDVVTDVVIVPADPTAFLADPLYIAATAYEVLPGTAQLRTAARLRIRFDAAHVPAGVNESWLRIRQRDRVQNRWRDCTHLGVAAGIVEASIVEPAVFAVVSSKAPTPASITVTPTPLALEEGDIVQLSAVVRDATGEVISVPVTWTSDQPTIATVDQTGLVTAIAEGSATISATAGTAASQAPVSVKRKPRPATVTVTPATASVAVGATVPLGAEVRDETGAILPLAPNWSSSATGIATVSGTGLVTGVAPGSAVITARAQNVTGTAAITVLPPVTSVVIDEIGKEPLETGLTLQLNATAYNAAGQPIPAVITWTTSSASVATVDQTGLVLAVGRGTATITAAVGPASDAVNVRVVGESTEEAGNNMSWPTVFADGIGITGLAVATDPGVRPTTAEGIVVTALPFFWSGNAPTFGAYYEQQTFNTWRAMYLDGKGHAPFDGEAYWGDNLTVRDWSAARPIRVEIALSATGVGTLTGYPMTFLYGEGTTEMQGSNGTTAEFVPLMYAVGATITVEKLTGQGGTVSATVVDE
ncbi:MAG: Ig-like domain-containing protein, partial [Gemmatimonadales bacterium]